MKQLSTLLGALMVLLAFSAYSQAPQAFNYSGIALSDKDKELSNDLLGIKAAILQDDMVIYEESHAVQTDNKGMFNIRIGEGTLISGVFSTIDWGAGPTFLEVFIDPQGGTNYQSLGPVELLSVPYALYSGASTTGDGDPLNEVITSVELDGNTVKLTEGTSVAVIDLSPIVDGLPDNDPANELQVLSLDGNMLSISGGNEVALPQPAVSDGAYAFFDGDGDMYGDPSRPVWVPSGVSAPEGFVSESGDTNDNDPADYPGSGGEDPNPVLCVDDAALGVCAAAWNLGPLSVGQSQAFNGLIFEDQPQDWFRVDVPNIGTEADPDNFKIQLVGENATNYHMDIYLSCGSTALASGVTVFNESPGLPHYSSYLIKVTRTAEGYPCESYSLVVSR